MSTFHQTLGRCPRVSAIVALGNRSGCYANIPWNWGTFGVRGRQTWQIWKVGHMAWRGRGRLWLRRVYGTWQEGIFEKVRGPSRHAGISLQLLLKKQLLERAVYCIRSWFALHRGLRFGVRPVCAGIQAVRGVYPTRNTLLPTAATATSELGP